LAPLLQRLAADSLRLGGREFVAPTQGNFRRGQGIREVGQGIGGSAAILMSISPVGVPPVDLLLTGRISMAK